MKKTISDTPRETLLRLAAEAGQLAAQNAVKAGRTVTGIENGRTVSYGPGNPIPRSEVVKVKKNAALS